MPSFKTTQVKYLILIIILSLGIPYSSVHSQVINVGQGSYTKTLPSGEKSATDQNGNPILPNVAGNFTKLEWFPSFVPVTTNDFWSNVLFRYAPDEPAYVFAHPFELKIDSSGVVLGYADNSIRTDVTSSDNYTYISEGQLEIGLSGIDKSTFKATDYSDWTATTTWTTESTSLEATFGHGLPFVYFKSSGADITISNINSANIWYENDNVLGVTIDGKHFGLFAPSGSVWASEFPLVSSLNDQGFFSIAILPDSSLNTFNYFKKHAYAFVDETYADWDYDPQTNQVSVEYNVTTTLMDDSETHVNSTLQALYRHQWLNSTDVFTEYSYVSPRGVMKVVEGNSFSTSNSFIGILPFLPDLGEYDRVELQNYLTDMVGIPIGTNEATYVSGKEMGKYAQLIHIADQLGDLSAKNKLLDEVKIALESWLVAGGNQQYYYDENWKVLIGFPASHGSNYGLNDQHFHHGYAILAAATVAQYDSAWASQENWGGMINLLIKNASNWDKKDKDFPYLRNFDIYAGHSWADGRAAWRLGNNQESSSESMNYAVGTFLWGQITGQDEIRDLGAYLYTIESEAIDQYWFDVDNEVFPENFDHQAVGMVTGAGGKHGTWFSSNIEMIHGINFLPITSGSVYLGKHPDYILKNYNQIVEERGSQPLYWKDILWSFLALSDAGLALSYFSSDQDYEVFDGETKARTMHWIYNLNTLGHINTEVQANIPTYNVFVDSEDDTTYIAYNSDPSTKKVTFSNGFSFDVPPRQTLAYSRSMSPDTVGLPTNKPEFAALKVISLFSDFYESSTKITIPENTSGSTKASFRTIANNNVLALKTLDSQTIQLETITNISTRSHVFGNVWSSHDQTIILQLTQGEQISESVTITLKKDEWISIDLAIADFGNSIDFTKIDGMTIQGNATVILDDLLFYGDTPVKLGPDESASIQVRLPENVMSIFSDQYEDVEEVNLNPDNEQSTQLSFYVLEEDSILKLSNLDLHIIEINEGLEASNMDGFFFNYWTQESNELSVSLAYTDGKEETYTINVRKNSWQSIDVTLADFFVTTSAQKISQIKFTGDETVFIDNILFYKYPEVTEAPIPPHNPENVLSLFSDTYTEYREAYPEYNQMSETLFSAPHDETSVEVIEINGNQTLFYDNNRYTILEFFKGISADGIQDNGIDGTNLTNVRFDFYTQAKTDPSVAAVFKLVDFGGDAYGGGNDTEDEFVFNHNSIPKIESHKWITVDVALDSLPGMTARKNLSQMLLFNLRGGPMKYYIDNLYFYSDQAINSAEDYSLTHPKDLNLFQNYPNPFNPNTNIQFDLPTNGYTVLKVYNSVGQLVQTLVDQNLQAGRHNYNFNANQLASGIYFCRIEFGSQIITNKMILLK
jgi:endoglucanase Acf2